MIRGLVVFADCTSLKSHIQ